MKQLYYTLMTLLRERSSNFIKVILLALGLFVGLLMMARVTFELGFDKNYHDVEKLMRIKTWYTIGGEKRNYPSEFILEPLPAAIMENFSEEVESATVVNRTYGHPFYNGTHRLDIDYVNYVDSNYFRTMGIEVISGDIRTLGNIDVIFLSESVSRKIYGKENPIGKVLYMDKNYPLIVRGVFEDVPENTTLRNDVVISFPTIHKISGYQRGGWMSDDSFRGYVRLKSPDPAGVNSRIDQMVEKYMPDNGKDGFMVEYFLQPIQGEYANLEDVRMMILIMSLLAFVVLAIAALNYILISMSSFGKRSKAIGIHKCLGASGGNIISMFLMETAILVFISLLIVGLILINFKDWIEDIVFASLKSLFSLDTLWIPVLIILIIFALVGFLPGRIMASMPVSHAFRQYTEKKTTWKKPLLFVQFTGTAFMSGLLMVILMQYNHTINSDLGYNPDNVAMAYISEIPDMEFLKDELRRMPMVDEVSVACHDLMNGWGALPVKDQSGKQLFTTRWNGFDSAFLPLMEIQLAEGRNIDGPGQILINEKYVETMRMQESPIGKPLSGVDRGGIVVGVMKNFPIRDFYAGISPVMVEAEMKLQSGWILVKARDLTTQSLAVLNKKVEEICPQNDIRFDTMDWRIREQYEGVRRFRDGVLLSALVIIIIAIAGLIGYIGDEILRRSKELAIRKVNGADTANIFELFTGNILWVAVPAIATGVIGAWLIGDFWLEQFYEKVNIPVVFYIVISIFILLLIMASIIIKTWRIANENPVKSLKNE